MHARSSSRMTKTKRNKSQKNHGVIISPINLPRNHYQSNWKLHFDHHPAWFDGFIKISNLASQLSSLRPVCTIRSNLNHWSTINDSKGKKQRSHQIRMVPTIIIINRWVPTMMNTLFNRELCFLFLQGLLDLSHSEPHVIIPSGQKDTNVHPFTPIHWAHRKRL